VLGVAAYSASRAAKLAVLPTPGLRSAYTMFGLSALLSCSALPAALLFRGAWGLEMEHYVRSTQLDLAQRVDATSFGARRIVASEPLWNTAVQPAPAAQRAAGDCGLG
jgi:hypothetical protein